MENIKKNINKFISDLSSLTLLGLFFFPEKNLKMMIIKGILHPNMEILLSSTHPHVIPNLWNTK